MSLPVVVLAGGLATRMRPLTETIPKALLPVAGKPFIDWQFDLLRRNHIKQVVICVGYLGEQIEAYISDKDYGLDIVCSYDGATQLGTGGALKKASDLVGNSFFVLYGDSYLDVDYSHVESSWRNSGKMALMTVFYNDNQWDMSNVQYVNGQIVCYSKSNRNPNMHHIDYGLGIMTAKALEHYGQVFDLADTYSDLAKNNELAGYEVKERFYEIGSPNGLAEFEDKLLKENYSI